MHKTWIRRYLALNEGENRSRHVSFYFSTFHFPVIRCLLSRRLKIDLSRYSPLYQAIRNKYVTATKTIPRKEGKREKNRYSFLNPPLRLRWKCIRQFYDGQIRANSLNCRKCRASGLSPSTFRIFTSHTNLTVSACNSIFMSLKCIHCKTVWDRRSR